LLPLVLLLVPLGLGGYHVGRHLWADYHFRAAGRALERRDFGVAHHHLRACLTVHRRNPELLLLAARTARRANDYEAATQYLDLLALVQAGSAVGVRERLLAAAQQGQLDAAAEGQLWALVKDHHPESILILEALTRGYLHVYRLGSALECLQCWLARQPDCVQAMLWRGQIWEGMHREDEARNDYLRALELAPEDNDAHLRLAVFLAYTNQAAEALPHFERVRQKQPHNPTVVVGLARCHYVLGQTAQAEQLLDARLRDDPHDLAALRERGKIALYQGHVTEAEPWLRQTLELDPYDSEGLSLLILCLHQQEKHAEARALSGQLKQVEADLDELAQLNREVLKDPENAGPRCQAGLLCLRNGQEQEGLRWFAGALQVDPQHRPTHQALADYFERTGLADRAAEHRARALSR
jgi:tetratricopeptide (TPR) repeat protein